MARSLSPQEKTIARQTWPRMNVDAVVVTDEATLFGATEFAVRQHALQLVGQAYSRHLAEKKTATAVRRSTARSAARPRRFTATGNETP